MVTRYWFVRLLAAIALAAPPLFSAASKGVHGIDFENFEYPWRKGSDRGTPPWNWMDLTPRSHVRLHKGRLTFDPTDVSRSGYIQLESVTYGDLDGDGQDEAAVDLLYSTGGTANWHYLYVFKSINGTAVPIGILRSGSRADGGLVSVRISQGLLILEFNDNDRSAGDCCSRGLIRVRYRLQDGRFVETGPRQLDSTRFATYPFEKSGPQTVKTKVHEHETNIVYTDAQGVEKQLTSLGHDWQPNLSSDKTQVVFIREANSRESEIWAVGTDGSGLRLLFRGPIHWKNHVYSSSSIRSPQWSADGEAVYFVTDFSLTSGALWRLDLTTGKAAVIIPEAVMYGVIQTGRYRGYIVANQRSPSRGDPHGRSYPLYPFFLYTARGEKMQQLADEDDGDLDRLLADWENR